MTFAESVLSEVIKKVSVPDDLLEFLYLLLEREERDEYPSVKHSDIPEKSYSDVYAYVLIEYLSDLPEGSQYDIKLQLDQVTPLARESLKGLSFSYSYIIQDLLKWNVHYRFKQGLRRKHSWILGETGSGKTQLIQQMILSDLQTNASIIVIDSQGDLINKLKRSKAIDPERLVIVDPLDSVEYPLALNMFDVDYSHEDQVSRERHISGVVELLNFVFSAMMDSALTDKQSVVFNFCIRLLLAIPHSTLETFVEILENGVGPYQQCIRQLPPVAQKFFSSAFPEDLRQKNEYRTTRQEILRRLYFLMENPTISRLFQSTSNKLNISREMDRGKVILISTDRSLLKRQGCAFFGRYFISLIAQAMQDRLNRPEHHRRKCYLYIDECGDYLNTLDVNITDILEKGRKYNVSITLAHQQLQQLPVEILHSIRTNTALKFVGSCSPQDAKALEAEFSGTYIGKWGFPHFVCSPKGLTSPFGFRINAGALENTEQRTDEELEAVMELNRAKYCVLSEPAPLLKVAEPTLDEHKTDKSDETKGIPKDPLADYT